MQVVNQAFLAAQVPEQITVEVVKVEEYHELIQDNPEAELDEMWSYVGRKDHRRWLYHSIPEFFGLDAEAFLGYWQSGTHFPIR